MLNYHKIIDKLLSIKKDEKEDKQSIQKLNVQIIEEIKLNHKNICLKQCSEMYICKTKMLINVIINSNSSELFKLLKDMLELLYVKQSELLKVVYLHLPEILRRYIQSQQHKNAEIQGLAKFIHSKQSSKYVKYLKEKEDIHKSNFIRELYESNFNKDLISEMQSYQPLSVRVNENEQSQSITADRRSIKIVLLNTIYRHISHFDDNTLKEYLKTIFIYCGGEMKVYSNISSFYLLEKKNLYNLFKYSISQHEIQWMLLSLYELSIQKNKEKLQLLAAINMIYKKTANESMFKYSQIAQSIIHLLEDQYHNVFA